MAETDPSMIREFDDAPRDEGELELRASWLTRTPGAQPAGCLRRRSRRRQGVQADGSYLGINFGNFMLSAGYMERWWGPAGTAA
jgi:hypothetical protein